MLDVTPDDRHRPAEPSGAKPDGASLRKAGVSGGITVLLNLVSLALAVGMVVTLFYISQSVRRVAELEERLSSLTRFEQRLVGQIDTVNQGFHSQFDELGGRLSALSGQLSGLERQVQALAEEYRALAGRIDALDAEPTGAELAGAEEPRPQAREVVLPAPRSTAAAESRSAPQPAPGAGGEVQFKRVEAPDGKVTYSRVR